MRIAKETSSSRGKHIDVDNGFQQKLSALKRDYESVTGGSWNHFYCPVLYRDDDTELCRAHVVNKGFREADRSWTVQRKDVDNYYGTLFEADFLALERIGELLVEEALTDRNVARQFRPELVLDGEVQDYYFQPDRLSVPETHTRLDYYVNDQIVPLVLKLSPDEMEQSAEKRWQIIVEKDVRLAALASLLKAAHLTLFHRLGYQYALSSGGRYLGRQALGEFFFKTRNLHRTKALEFAESHFRPYASVVRPFISPSSDFKGTLTDGLFFACGSGPEPWGLQVLIRFGGQMHAVIVPTLVDAECAAMFSKFLDSPFPRVEMRMGRICQDRLEVSPKSQMVEWPETAYDPPE